MSDNRYCLVAKTAIAAVHDSRLDMSVRSWLAIDPALSFCNLVMRLSSIHKVELVIAGKLVYTLVTLESIPIVLVASRLESKTQASESRFQNGGFRKAPS